MENFVIKRLRRGNVKKSRQPASKSFCLSIIVIKTTQIFQFSSWTHGRIVLLPLFSGQQWPCEFLWVITWEVLCVISSDVLRIIERLTMFASHCFGDSWKQLLKCGLCQSGSLSIYNKQRPLLTWRGHVC